MPFFSRLRHSTAVERRPVGYLLTFGFFRLPRGVPRKLLSGVFSVLSMSINIRNALAKYGRFPWNTLCSWPHVRSNPVWVKSNLCRTFGMVNIAYVGEWLFLYIQNLWIFRPHLIVLSTVLITYNVKLLVLIMEIQRVYCEVEMYFIYFLNTFQTSNTQVLQLCSANALKCCFFFADRRQPRPGTVSLSHSHYGQTCFN